MKFYLAVLLLWFMSACRPGPDQSNLYQKSGLYPHPKGFTSPVALFIRERNGQPFILASAFLIDKPKGLFASAKHFVGNESNGQCKIFFNGRVYGGFLVTVPAVTDVAIIKIEDPFDSSQFPEPYLLAAEVQAGEKVFVQGIHPHPPQFQENKVIIPIFEKYYGLVGKGDEFVFDNLEAEVVDTDEFIANNSIQGSSELTTGLSGKYIKLQTKEEHRLAADKGFAGLSGGPTINERQEVIGINSNETQAYVEINQNGLTYHPWKTLNLVSAEEIKKLLPKLAGLK